MSRPLSIIGRTCLVHKRLNTHQVILGCRRSTVAEVSAASDASSGVYEAAEPFSKIPGPKGLPIVGSWLDYKLNPSKIHRRDKLIRELQAEYGDIVKEKVAGRTIVHLFRPDYIRQVYEAEGKLPTIPPLLEVIQTYKKDKDLAPGLGFSNGEDWYRVRSIVQQIMVRPQKALDYLPVQNEVSNDFVSKLATIIGKNGEVENFSHWIARWGLESAAKITFDTRLGYLEDKGFEEADKIIKCTSDVFDISAQLFFSLPLYKVISTPSVKRMYEAEDHVYGEGKRQLKLAIQEYEKLLAADELTDDRFRFLSFMLSRKTISDGDVSAVVKSVFTDTLSTTTQAVLFNLYMLAINPEAQEKAYEEATTLLSSSGDLSKKGFNSSKYIKACLKETFRFLPIGLDIQRKCPSNLVIGGYQVPKDTYMVIEPFVSLNNPDHVTDPESFLPERWLREEIGTDKVHPYLLIPFSIGTRMCAGRRFAEQELVMMLAKILVRYRMEWHHEPLNMRYRMLQVPSREVSIKFIPR